MDSMQPLSDTAGPVLDIFFAVQERDGLDYLRYEMDAFDDLVFEGHRGPYFPLDPDADSVQATAFMAYHYEVNGDLLCSPAFRFLRHGGRWYPFGFKRDGMAAKDVRFLTVENGALALCDHWYAGSKRTMEFLAEEYTPESMYDEIRAYAEEFLPMVHRRYADVPATPPEGTEALPTLASMERRIQRGLDRIFE
jgi:hypothetical protein